ncbi:unnamed protein product [marine sediment metagenome]|uniref:Uncharacterized protein n=1 Tax=marine sediment metagenome TaxID=412755 RepID=X1HCY2_9ZZZZ
MPFKYFYSTSHILKTLKNFSFDENKKEALEEILVFVMER